MDYFYAGSGFGNKGLVDYYIKAIYQPAAAVKVSVDLHQFSSASAVQDAANTALSRNFGEEADLVCTYALTKQIGFEAGYAHFFSTASLSSAQVKNITNPRENSNWAYLTVNILTSVLFRDKN